MLACQFSSIVQCLVLSRPFRLKGSGDSREEKMAVEVPLEL